MTIKKENLKNLLLFLVGLFCQLNPMLSRGMMIVYLGFCTLLFILSINIKKIRISKGLLWYGLFVLYCMVSLTYTINNINPDYVYMRILTYLYLVFLVSPFLNEKKNIESIIKGFIIGGLFGITIVLIKQYNLIGVKRLGANIYGSYAEFGNTCMLTMSCFIWIKNRMFKSKIIKIFLFIFIAAGIILSGARKAILVPILMFLFLKILDRRSKMEKKVFSLTIISILVLIITYASLNNQTLYKAIGYRIESGISSVLGKDEEDASLNERERFKILAKKMIMEKPIQGWGIHAFAYRNQSINGRFVYSHDNYLEILSCYGILGFIIYSFSFIYILSNFKRYIKNDIGLFLLSYVLIILIMDLYSISFLNGYYILIICSAIEFIGSSIMEDNYEKSIKKCM